MDGAALYDFVLMREAEPGAFDTWPDSVDGVTALVAALGSDEFTNRLVRRLLDDDIGLQAELARPLGLRTKAWVATVMGFEPDESGEKVDRAGVLARAIGELRRRSAAEDIAGEGEPAADWRSPAFHEALLKVSEEASLKSPPLDISALYDLVLARAPEPNLSAESFGGVAVRYAIKSMLASSEFEDRLLGPLLKGAGHAPPELWRAIPSESLAWASMVFAGEREVEAAILSSATRGGALLAIMDAFGAPASGAVPRPLWRSAPVTTALREVAGAPAAFHRDYDLLDSTGAFDRAYYLGANPELARTGVDPLWHFLTFGALEQRNPSASFDVAQWWLKNGGAVAPDVNPLAQFLRFGSAEELAARDLNCPFGAGGLPPAIPLKFNVDPHLGHYPTLNLLLPAARLATMSGGPNTAVNLAFRLALNGFPVRVISTDLPPDADLRPLLAHIRNISEHDGTPAVFDIVDGSDRDAGVSIGANDVFFATAWWTAQMAHWGAGHIGAKPMVYLIQDYEPILHSASSQYALAKETYGFDHIPVINTSFLAEYLLENKIGKFGEPDFTKRALVFEPAIDTKKFFNQKRLSRKRRLLFYARPHNGIRNLFEIGLASLRSAIEEGVLDPDEWEFVGMGEHFAPIPLPRGAMLRCARWLGINGYAKQMRESEILLSLMLSPHPSYPPLEMAGCGGVVVTNSYENKTGARLQQISSNILTAEPSVSALVEALARAVARVPDLESRSAASKLPLPTTWDESLDGVVRTLGQRLNEIGLHRTSGARPYGEPVELAMPQAGDERYARFLQARSDAQAGYASPRREPGLLTFVSTVWNTAPAFLDVLARSVDAQEGGLPFEWLILDNGSTRADTRQWLAAVANKPYVRLQRVEENLGIIGGMRHVLHEARGRYILPLDSDDYLYPNCVRMLTWYIQKLDYPTLVYTDEDKLLGETSLGPYLKPDFDPVLFSNSCYIAHLCAIDRNLAIELGAYSDPAPEGSHDWDTFTRFFNAGHTAMHVPEVLYSWRMHSQSTAANIDSKPVVYESQLAVLRRYVAERPLGERLSITKSPFFGATPDWWLRRRRDVPIAPMTTLVVRSSVDGGATPNLKLEPGSDHDVVHIPPGAKAADLAPHVRRCALQGRLVHIIASEVSPDDGEWIWEAAGLLESYPDAVMVGGRLHTYNEILEAGRFRGVGEDGFGCPDRGRSLSDPGYFAQMWKPHSVGAVSAMHAVVRADFLLSVLEGHEQERPSIQHLGCWLGAAAAAQARRVVYSPFLSAETKIDWSSLVDPQEKRRLVDRYRALGSDRSLRSPHFDGRPGAFYTPTADPKPVWAPSIPAAADKADDRARRRVGFSLLTTLYIGSDADLFSRTAESVMAQTHRNFEWIVLTHGPISPALRIELNRMRFNHRVRLYALPTNLGIIGGMRYVLERARKEYVVPLDGDDLLTADALAMCATAASTQASRPAFIYTDEDILIGETTQSPFPRPDWDPVLDLENSWIWHLVAFRREEALTRGVYSDPQVEYCHDWDTTRRLAYLGAGALHVAGVAYHWRHHERSTSNSGAENSGSAASSRRLLERTLLERRQEERYEVRPYPINRGATEWWLGPRGEAAAGPVWTMPRAGEDWRGIEAWIAEAGDRPFVFLQAEDTSPITPMARADAQKLFDFVSDLAVVGGRVIVGDTVVSAGLRDVSGTLSGAYEGTAVQDLGPYALASKPQSILAPIPELCAVRGSFLREALASRPYSMSPPQLGLWLGAFARSRGSRAAFSPLLNVQSERRDGWWRFDALYTPPLWDWCLRQAASDRRDQAAMGETEWRQTAQGDRAAAT